MSSYTHYKNGVSVVNQGYAVGANDAEVEVIDKDGNVVSGGSLVAESITGGDDSFAITGQAGIAGEPGGNVIITGGIAITTDGGGGFSSLRGATPTLGNAIGGDASIRSGAGLGTGSGGLASVAAGNSGTGATGNGGAATVTAGSASSTNGAGGAVSVTSGAGAGTGAGGAITVTSGASDGASGTAGSITIDVGAAAGGTAGSINLGTTNNPTVELGTGAHKNGAAFLPFMFSAATEVIAASAPGAVSVACYCTIVSSDGGGDVWTLASGTQIGQLKKILYKTDGGAASVTGAFRGTTNTLTFVATGEYAVFIWDGTDWLDIELSSVTADAAPPALTTV